MVLNYRITLLVLATSVVLVSPSSGGEGWRVPYFPVFPPSVCVDDGINPEHLQPAAARGYDGFLYVIYTEREDDSFQPNLLMLNRSFDGGTTWLDTARVVNNTESHMVFFPAIDLMGDSSIVAAWTEMNVSPTSYEIRFSRSKDCGETWTNSTAVHPTNDEINRIRPSIAMAGSRIVISFWELTSELEGVPCIVYSDTFGWSWSEPLYPFTQQGMIDGSAPALAFNTERGEIGIVWAASDGRILFSFSTDGGDTWSNPVRVNDVSANNADTPDLDCMNGSYYVVWMDDRNGRGDCDVWCSSSVDGLYFTPSVKVNDDRIPGNQSEPHIRTDGSGSIHVCWSSHIPFDFNIDLYYSVSNDGGMSWSWIATRVNDVPFVIWPDWGWTSDLVVDEQGDAYIFWNDRRENGSYDHIYFATNRHPAPEFR